MCRICKYFNEALVAITLVTGVNHPIKEESNEATRNLPRLENFNSVIRMLFQICQIMVFVKTCLTHFSEAVNSPELTADNSGVLHSQHDLIYV